MKRSRLSELDLADGSLHRSMLDLDIAKRRPRQLLDDGQARGQEMIAWPLAHAESPIVFPPLERRSLLGAEVLRKEMISILGHGRVLLDRPYAIIARSAASVMLR